MTRKLNHIASDFDSQIHASIIDTVDQSIRKLVYENNIYKLILKYLR